MQGRSGFDFPHPNNRVPGGGQGLRPHRIAGRRGQNFNDQPRTGNQGQHRRDNQGQHRRDNQGQAPTWEEYREMWRPHQAAGGQDLEGVLLNTRGLGLPRYMGFGMGRGGGRGGGEGSGFEGQQWTAQHRRGGRGRFAGGLEGGNFEGRQRSTQHRRRGRGRFADGGVGEGQGVFGEREGEVRGGAEMGDDLDFGGEAEAQGEFEDGGDHGQGQEHRDEPGLGARRF